MIFGLKTHTHAKLSSKYGMGQSYPTPSLPKHKKRVQPERHAMQYTPKIKMLSPSPFLHHLQVSKTPQIHMQLRHPERHVSQTIISLCAEAHVAEIVLDAGEIDAQVGEAFHGGQVQDVVEEGRDVAGEVGDGLRGDPGEDVLEVVVFAGEQVATASVSTILKFP